MPTNFVGSPISFTIPAATASTVVSVGATYTNNGQTFTVLSAVISGGTTLICSGSGAPLASGTLTYASGTGPATISFTAESIPNIALTLNDGNLVIKGQSGANPTSQTFASITLSANGVNSIVLNANSGPAANLTSTGAMTRRAAPPLRCCSI